MRLVELFRWIRITKVFAILVRQMENGLSLSLSSTKINYLSSRLSCSIDSGSFSLFWLFSGYIGEFELVDDHRAGKIVVELNGRLNKCGVISPRYNVGVGELEAWTARLLPSRQVCVCQAILIIECAILQRF